MKKLLLLGLALTLTACAGRDPKPVPLRSQFDGSVTCDVLALEKQANQRLFAHLAGEQNDEEAYNLVVSGLALGFFPVVLAYDLSNAERVESDSLINRNSRINALRVVRGCITEANAPSGYDSFSRGALPYGDGSGRQFMLTSNRYTYVPGTGLVQAGKPQPGPQPDTARYGKAASAMPSLY